MRNCRFFSKENSFLSMIITLIKVQISEINSIRDYDYNSKIKINESSNSRANYECDNAESRMNNHRPSSDKALTQKHNMYKQKIKIMVIVYILAIFLIPQTG